MRGAARASSTTRRRHRCICALRLPRRLTEAQPTALMSAVSTTTPSVGLQSTSPNLGVVTTQSPANVGFRPRSLYRQTTPHSTHLGAGHGWKHYQQLLLSELRLNQRIIHEATFGPLLPHYFARRQHQGMSQSTSGSCTVPLSECYHEPVRKREFRAVTCIWCVLALCKAADA